MTFALNIFRWNLYNLMFVMIFEGFSTAIYSIFVKGSTTDYLYSFAMAFLVLHGILIFAFKVPDHFFSMCCGCGGNGHGDIKDFITRHEIYHGIDVLFSVGQVVFPSIIIYTDFRNVFAWISLAMLFLRFIYYFILIFIRYKVIDYHISGDNVVSNDIGTCVPCVNLLKHCLPTV